MNSATMIDSLSGAMNGATTLVAISDVPSGSFSISGRATSVNSSFWKNASGTKQIAIAMTARSSRSRSSSRCEISVPSASGSPLPGLVAHQGPSWWCRGCDGRSCGRRVGDGRSQPSAEGRASAGGRRCVWIVP